jgi:hypothetical protein
MPPYPDQQQQYSIEMISHPTAAGPIPVFKSTIPPKPPGKVRSI